MSSLFLLEEMDIEAEISMIVVKGVNAQNTMRSVGVIKGHLVIVLLDTGSSRNFISQKVVEQLKLPLHSVSKLRVRVASGESMTSNGMCVKIPLQLQGYSSLIDFHIFHLGTKWLQTLGTISWNFEKLMMQFQFEGKEVEFKGIRTSKTAIISGKSFKISMKKSQPQLVLQLLESGPILNNVKLSHSQQQEL